METRDTTHSLPPTLNYARRMATMPRSCIREILSSKTSGKLISFGGGVPHDSCIPLDTIQKAFENVLSRHGANALSYSSSEGEPALREYIAYKFLRTQGLDALPDQVLIVNGSQQALDLVGKAFIDPESIVAVEHPTYLAALQAFSAFEPRYAEVAMDELGAMPDQLERQLRNSSCRFFYTIPTFQNPSGACCSETRRMAIAEVMAGHSTMLVEDDPYSRIYFSNKPPPPPICSYRVDDAMLLGTFSKMVAPGLRLGWIWTKSKAMRHMITLKQASDLCTGRFAQLLVLETLLLLDFDSHLARVRSIYRSRRDVMHTYMLQHLARHCTWQVPQGGMFFWARRKNSEMSSRNLLEKCVKAGVAFADGASFFATGDGSEYLRLNFTRATDEEMDEGLGIVGRVLDNI